MQLPASILTISRRYIEPVDSVTLATSPISYTIYNTTRRIIHQQDTMRFTTLITTFTSFLTIAVAVPVAQEPHKVPTPASAESTRPSSGTASHVSSHLPSPSMVGAYACPPKQLKQCCQSLQEESKGIVKGLGEIVPILGGIQISSKITFQCKFH